MTQTSRSPPKSLSVWWTNRFITSSQDYAGDPRQFYFGNKRQQAIQTQSTMNQKSYAKLVRERRNS